MNRLPKGGKWLVIGAIAFLMLLASRVRVGATADAVAVLRTAGMTCSSCSGTITKALQGVEGVAVTEVDLDGGLVLVGYDTNAVTPETLAAKVSGAGFASSLQQVLTPAEFRRLMGRDMGQRAVRTAGGCGAKGGGCGGVGQN